MSIFGFIRESVQFIGAILAGLLAYHYIKEVRRKKPDIFIDIKKNQATIGKEFDPIVDQDTKLVDSYEEYYYSKFRFNIEFQNKGYAGTYITDMMLWLIEKEPVITWGNFQPFEVPPRKVVEKEFVLKMHGDFSTVTDIITLEFITLDGDIINKNVEINSWDYAKPTLKKYEENEVSEVQEK